ncbi:MAG: GNAT family N-acetyltransferase [Steroidobacteraceae bacterium]
MAESIFEAVTAGHYQIFAGLVAEYVQWCRDRYQHDVWFVREVFGHQSLDSELQQLAQVYGPPQGKTLLASRDGQICGGGAYRRLPDGSCEMKRLFVPDRFKGHGIGRRLCRALMISARDEGYAWMRLDTATLLTEAIGMYKSLGFRECPPHRAYPDELMSYLIFMEISLARPWAEPRKQ